MKLLMKLMLATFSLLISNKLYAEQSIKAEMALTLAPYVLAIDDEKPFRTAGKVMLTQITSVAGYLISPQKIDPWAVSAGTNMALLCNLQSRDACIAGLAVGSYVLYHRSQFGTESAIGFTIGVASGSLVPGIVANF